MKTTLLGRIFGYARASSGALAMVLLSGIAHADSGWILTTEDFKDQPVSVLSIDDSGVRVSTFGATATEKVISYDNLLQIDRGPSARGVAPLFTLITTTGDRLGGQPTGLKDENVVWSNPVLGELKVPLKSASVLARAGKSPGNLERNNTDDMVRLANGDLRRGIIADITDTSVKISSDGEVDIPFETLDWVVFAVTETPKMSTGRAFRIRLLDGSSLVANSLTATADKLTVTLPDKIERAIPLSSVAGIEQLNGPVSWLSSRTPEAIAQAPYFGSAIWPTRMDQTVGGKPIQFGGRTFSRGIGVHSYSRVDYSLEGGYEAFRTQYAIATEDKRQYADVSVCIKIDDKVVHERKDFKADSISPVVFIDIPAGAKKLTLEVGYGAANDVQDRFNWIEPALLRKKPANVPAAAASAAK